jgi:hypothetical protein
MAEMSGKVTPAASDRPGVFRFSIETIRFMPKSFPSPISRASGKITSLKRRASADP